MVRIMISTCEFEMSHGTRPRGRGGWGFFVGFNYGENCINTDDVGRVVWANNPRAGAMTYTDAVRWVTAAIRALAAWFGVDDADVFVEVAS